MGFIVNKHYYRPATKNYEDEQGVGKHWEYN